MTKRKSQEQVKKTLGRKPKGWIDDVYVPACVENIWSHFWELDSGRAGMEPLTYSEISSYMAVTDVSMSSTEVRCIKAMDNARIKTTIEVSNSNG